MSELTEAGRALSAANEAKLRSAASAIEDVLAALGDPDAIQDKKDDRAQGVNEALREGANVGDWLESEMHTEFVEMIDDLFSDGNISRDERQALFAALDASMAAFLSSLQGSAPALYSRAYSELSDPDEEDEGGLDEAAKTQGYSFDSGDFNGGCSGCGYGLPSMMSGLDMCPFCEMKLGA